MGLNKIDIKSWFIIILGIALVISFFFGQKTPIDIYKDEIKELHDSNDRLSLKNDSLKNANNELDSEILDINKQLLINSKELSATQSELDKLKKRKNEIFTHVNNLSANGVANAFSDYLNTKSPNTR